jgi:hypothetical protein
MRAAGGAGAATGGERLFLVGRKFIVRNAGFVAALYSHKKAEPVEEKIALCEHDQRQLSCVRCSNSMIVAALGPTMQAYT